MGGVDLLIAITDRSRSEAFADWFQEQGATLLKRLPIFSYN